MLSNHGILFWVTMNQLPNFLIIGFPKSGTHALLRNMGEHPEIYTYPHEVRFFGKKDAPLEEYKQYFKTKKQFRGEKSPLYVANADVMQRIAQTLPDVRILICVRHPIHMLHSFYNFRIWEYEDGYPSGFDPREFPFERIVTENLTVKNLCIDLGKYMNYISTNVLPFFDRQRIHVVIQERMWNDMAGEMNRIYKFLGAESWEGAYKVINSKNHGEDRYPRIDYRNQAYRDAIVQLRTAYIDSNQALFDFLQDDIPEWRYYDLFYGS